MTAGRDAERKRKSPADKVTETPLPADLARALDWLRGHLSEPIDLERLALVAGVRPRTLEAHFKRFLGTTPLGWVRQMRLAHARRELECARGDATVTDIALAAGFNQLGRFSVYYRTVFGEAPSTTLRQRRYSRAGVSDDVDDEAFRLTWQAMSIAPRECSEALETLESVRHMAPNYGLPVALAAWCWAQRAAHGFSASPCQDRDHALQLTQQACGLATNDTLCLTLASGALTLAHRLEEADRLLQQGLALDPWQPYAWVRRGWQSANMGDPDSAYRELTIALRLTPVGPMWHIAFIGIGCAHFASGRYAQAARWVQSGTEAFPGAYWADRIAVAAAVRAGAKGEACRIAHRLLRMDPHLTVEKARNSWPFPLGFMDRLCNGLEVAGIPRV